MPTTCRCRLHKSCTPALGLRCTTRSLRGGGQTRKPGWLALGAASIGCGIWTMHFIAMLGFSANETSIRYDIPLTPLSLAVAVVAVGVLIVGYRGTGRTALLTAGVITGLGDAGMHHIGMASMRMRGALRYDTVPTRTPRTRTACGAPPGVPVRRETVPPAGERRRTARDEDGPPGNRRPCLHVL